MLGLVHALATQEDRPTPREAENPMQLSSHQSASARRRSDRTEFRGFPSTIQPPLVQRQ
jgi:hypothetical protein